MGGAGWEAETDGRALLMLFIKQIAEDSPLRARGNLLRALQGPKREGNPGKGGACMHAADSL